MERTLEGKIWMKKRKETNENETHLGAGNTFITCSESSLSPKDTKEEEEDGRRTALRQFCTGLKDLPPPLPELALAPAVASFDSPPAWAESAMDAVLLAFFPADFFSVELFLLLLALSLLVAAPLSPSSNSSV